MTGKQRTASSVRQRWIVFAAVPVLASLFAYLWYDHRFPSWIEQVLLPDGRRIIVKQRPDFIEGYGTRKTWLTFSVPQMGGERAWLRAIFYRAFAAFALLALGACGDSTLKWKEEVRLDSGEVIVVQRTARLRGNYVPGGGGGSINEGMTVEIVQPVKTDNPKVWSDRFVPVVFDRDGTTGEWFLVATFYHCDSWYAIGRPKLPYTEYRFRNGRWEQQALSPQWIGRPANMATDIRPTGARDLGAAEKALDLKDPMLAPEYKSITTNWMHGC